MKPFDLEKAKAGHPLVTRDGRPAKFVAHLPECHADSQVVALPAGNCSAFSYSAAGRICLNDTECASDLFLATTKKTYWFAYSINCSTASGERSTTSLFDTKEELDRLMLYLHAPNWTITSIEIEE